MLGSKKINIIIVFDQISSMTKILPEIKHVERDKKYEYSVYILLVARHCVTIGNGMYTMT